MTQYALHLNPTTRRWQVVPVDAAQAQSMLDRGAKFVFPDPRQAHAVASRLNKE